MTGFRTKTLLAVATAGVLFAASPAFAYKWTCTATNSRHAHYTQVSVGFNSVLVHNRASSKALQACAIDSYSPQTCRILNCYLSY